MPPKVVRGSAHGAPLLTLEDQSFPLVRFVIALKVGASADSPGRGGALRLMLELLLRGTERSDRHAFNSALETLGSGVEAAVGHDTAYLSGVCLARHLQPTLELVGEALSTPRFDEAEFTALVEETVQGLRAERDDDDSLADLFLRRALYPDHPLGRSPVGIVEDLLALTVEDVRAAYQHVARNQMVVAMAGAVTPKEAEVLATRLLEPLRPQAASPSARPPLQEAKGLKIVVVDKPERTQVQLRLARLSIDGRHPDVDAFWLGITAFGGTFTSPLTRQVRDERGWSYFASADFRRRAAHTAPVVLRSAPSLEDALPCLELELQLYRDLAAGNLAPDTVTAARDYVLNRYPFDVATVYDVLPTVLSLELLGLPESRLWDVPAQLESIDAAEVGQVVGKHLDADNVVALLVAPAHAVMNDLKTRFPHASIEVVDFREGLGLRKPA